MNEPRLLFLCPDVINASGGMWVIYRHVDMLNDAGLNAVIVHQEPGFRYPWYTGRTAVTCMADVGYRLGDVLVVPEVCVNIIGHTDPSVPVVVFSQNCYLTPWERPANRLRADNPYSAPNVRAIVTTNTDNQRLLARAFRHLDVRRVSLSVSPLMSPDQASKEALVCYMPRKNADHAELVLGRLREAGALDGIAVMALHGRPHEEIAEILGRTSVFLSFGFPEGWALPPAEAMASGCVVAGYHGLGGLEYWAKGCTFPIEFNEIDAFVATALELMIRLKTDPASLHRIGRAAAASIRARYPADDERRSVVQTWLWVLERVEAP